MLVQLCAESCTERIPSRYICRITAGSPSRSKLPSMSSTAAILPAGVNAFDVRRGAGDFDALAVAADLFDRGIQHAQRLFGLEAPRIVVLRHEDGKEERAESALFGARQVELPVRFPLPDIAAVIELAIHCVNVAVEHQRARMQGARPFRHGRAAAVCAPSKAAAAATAANPQAAGI